VGALQALGKGGSVLHLAQGVDPGFPVLLGLEQDFLRIPGHLNDFDLTGLQLGKKVVIGGFRRAGQQGHQQHIE